MSKPKFLPVPEWVRPEQRQEFAVRLAALYHNRTGSLGKLCAAMDLSETALHMALKTPGGLNVQHCIKLEEILGRELFPREFFRPDIFIAE